MTNQELLDYIKKQSAAGFDKASISAALSAGGWRLDDIAEGFAAVQAISSAPAPTIVVPRTQPAVVSTIPQTQKRKSSGVLTLFISLLLLLIAGAIGTYGVLWYWQQLRPASSPPIQKVQTIPLAPVAATASTTATSSKPTPTLPAAPTLATYTFTPKTSNIPGLSFQYPPSLGTSTAQERTTGLDVMIGTATIPALKLDFSLFQNPLGSTQSPDDFLHAAFPSATLTHLDTSGRVIVKVQSSALPAGQSVYYLFLKNKMVMTIAASGSAMGTTSDSLVQSIQFQDPMY